MPEFDTAFEQIDELATRLMRAGDVPGLSLAVTDRNGLPRVAAYGFADLEAREPVHLGHLFEIGSIGKSFTAILLLQLADQGTLDLHAPVTEYLPWFQVQSRFEPITLHHLLTHTAGIIGGAEFSPDARYEVWALRETATSAPPGELFHYSNTGYKALGLVLERVTGKPYGTLVRERVLDPLGMKNTAPAITHAVRRRLARGYTRYYDDRPWRLEHGNAPATWIETNTADGCIAAPAADLAAYLRMLMKGGEGPAGRVMSEDSFRRMTAPHAIPREAGLEGDAGYGYGLLVRYDGERLVTLEHGGGMVGYTSLIRADLESGLGVVAMLNGDDPALDAIVDYALDVLKAAASGRELPAPPPMHDRFAVNDAATFTGTFASPDGEVTLVEDGPGLALRIGGEQARLEPRGDRAFIVHHDGFDRFLLRAERDEDGNVIALTHGPSVWRAPGASVDAGEPPADWSAYPGHYRSHNPWLSNFRVIPRESELLLVFPSGHEIPLTSRDNALFAAGRAPSPETIRFDTIVDGEALRAVFGGGEYYRFFVP